MGFYQDHIFPKFYDRLVRQPAFDRRRVNILSLSQEPLLEIGIGTGLNLEFYPATIHKISAVDPNPGMARELKARTSLSRVRVDFQPCGAESLPFPDASFRTVVSTLTLCSLPDLGAALSEIRRVLRPDGRFLFLDHGRSADPSVARWQRWLNPLQQKLACGCRLDVAIDEELKRAGFQIEKLERSYLENAPRFVGCLYEGTAKPPEPQQQPL